MTQDVGSLKTHFLQFSRTGAWYSLGGQALIAMAVLIVAALILMSTMLSELERSRAASVATHDTMLEMTTIETRLVEIDSVLRGYALSTDSWYLDRLKVDHSDIQASLNKLKRSLQNSPDQLQKLKELNAQIQRRIALDNNLSQPEHRSKIADSSVTPSARAVNEGIRARLWEILDRERATRELNNTTMISQARNTLLFAVGIVLLTFVFGALCLVLSISAKA